MRLTQYLPARLRFRVQRAMKYRRRTRQMRSLNFGYGDNEFFFTAYPKSGSTWLRVMLAYMMADIDAEDISFHNVGQWVPDSYYLPDIQMVQDRSSAFHRLPARVVKAHDPFMPFYRDKKWIYLIRDGRDVVASYYHFENARRETPLLPEAFLRGDTVKQGNWADHVLSWYEELDDRRIVVRYEDLRRDAASQLVRIAEYLGLHVMPKKIDSVLERSAFKRMKQLEPVYGYVNDNRTQEGKRVPFVRSGEVGQKDDVYTKAQMGEFVRANRKAFEAFDYPV